MAPKAFLLTLANLLIPIAILVFATGFFPYKPFMPGLAEYGELGWEDRIGWEKGGDGKSVSVPEAPFERLVFMVVDALRSDFVYGEESGMEFVQRYDEPSVQRRRLLTTRQSDSRRRRPSLHSTRHIPHHHHAPRQSHDIWLHTLLPRRHPELRRIRHLLHTRDARHLACAA